jgi:hypothetical protein
MDDQPPTFAQVSRIVSKIIERGEWKHLETLVNAGTSILDSHAKGKKWEADFMALALERGLAAIEVRAGLQHDCEIAGRRVQCKAADSRQHEPAAIDRMRPFNGSRAYSLDLIDVLALRCADGIWIIPAAALEDPKSPGYLRSRIIPADWKTWRDAWGIFNNHLPAPIIAQQTLFDD